MAFIMITVLIDMISIGLIIPVLPMVVGTFTASPTEQAWWYGAVTITYGIASFFAAPVLGALSDARGRRPMLLLGFCGLGISFFVTAMASALWMVVMVRMFSGAMQSNAAVAQAYVADITEPELRARRFGLLGAMFGIGFILGPVLGGVLGAQDVRLPFFVAGGMAVLNWLYGYFVLPESLPVSRRQPFSWRRVHPFAALGTLRQLQGVGPLVIVVGLAALAQFTLHTTWVLYTHFKFGWGPAEVGWSLFTVGAVSAVVQGWLLKHMLARFSPKVLAGAGLVSSALTYLGFGLASQPWMLYATIVVGGILGGGVQAAVQSLISNAAQAHQQGSTMGSLASINSFAAALAPVLATPLMGLVSHLQPSDWRMGLPFYFCAALQAGGAFLAIRFFRRSARLAAAPA
jgi:DHA1 family tetracycline resistance protein-like MFS transporter